MSTCGISKISTVGGLLDVAGYDAKTDVLRSGNRYPPPGMHVVSLGPPASSSSLQLRNTMYRKWGESES